MKRFTKSSIALAMLLALPVANSFAAESLSAKESSNLVPMKEISITGSYLQAQDGANDISKAADEAGAKYYHIKGMEQAANNSSNSTVYADIYQSNAPVATDITETTYNGVISYERNKALYYVPFEVITIKGDYNNTPDVTEAASKAAADKNAYAFYVNSVTPVDTKNQAQNVEVALYKKDAATRDYLTKGASHDQDVYEISSDAFKKMKPYDTISFHGQFNNVSEITAAAAKHALASGAHFYYVSEVSNNPAGTMQTISVSLYK